MRGTGAGKALATPPSPVRQRPLHDALVGSNLSFLRGSHWEVHMAHLVVAVGQSAVRKKGTTDKCTFALTFLICVPSSLEDLTQQ